MNASDTRVDPCTGEWVHVVGSRQSRPNLPSVGCPFCPGGLEAPEPYDVRWFTNRWPAMAGDRCEVVLYTSDHEASFADLGAGGARRVVDLWADRTRELGAREDVAYVMVFENRGPEVGATISHPHGQIYAFDHVPRRPAQRFAAGWRPDPDPGERLVARSGGWSAWVPYAPVFPLAVTIAPDEPVADLPSLDDAGRSGLAQMLVSVLGAVDRMWGVAVPYMLWLEQAPRDGGPWPDPWCAVQIVSPWRSPGVQRFIAAAEVAGGEYFNPVIPEDLAGRLRRSVQSIDPGHGSDTGRGDPGSGAVSPDTGARPA